MAAVPRMAARALPGAPPRRPPGRYVRTLASSQPVAGFYADHQTLARAARLGRGSVPDLEVMAAIERRHAAMTDGDVQHPPPPVPTECEGVWRMVFSFGKDYPPAIFRYLPVYEDLHLDHSGVASIETDVVGPLYIRFVGEWSHPPDADSSVVAYDLQEAQLVWGMHARDGPHAKPPPRVLAKTSLPPRPTRLTFYEHFAGADGTRAALVRSDDAGGNHTLVRHLISV